MFNNNASAWAAACTAEEVAEGSANYVHTFVESFLENFIGMLTDDARAIFWHVVGSMDATDPNHLCYVCELLRALRHASRLGLSAVSITDEFGSVEAVSFEGLLLWLVEDHGLVLAD